MEGNNEEKKNNDEEKLPPIIPILIIGAMVLTILIVVGAEIIKDKISEQRIMQHLRESNIQQEMQDASDTFHDEVDGIMEQMEKDKKEHGIE